jgi:hypothetical protein
MRQIQPAEPGQCTLVQKVHMRVVKVLSAHNRSLVDEL